MTKFFHISEKKLKKRYNRRIFFVNILPIAVILTLLAVVWINNNSLRPVIYYLTIFRILTYTVGYSFITVLIGSLISSKKLKYHKLHTYVEIKNKDLVVSRYKQTSFHGKNTIAYKKLWVINLADIKDIYYYKNNVVIIGPARLFYEQSEWLTYTHDRSGIKFDNWWYDINGSIPVRGIEIKDMFLSPKRIARTIQNTSGIMREKSAQRKKFREHMLAVVKK